MCIILRSRCTGRTIKVSSRKFSGLYEDEFSNCVNHNEVRLNWAADSLPTDVPKTKNSSHVSHFPQPSLTIVFELLCSCWGLIWRRTRTWERPAQAVGQAEQCRKDHWTRTLLELHYLRRRLGLGNVSRHFHHLPGFWLFKQSSWNLVWCISYDWNL